MALNLLGLHIRLPQLSLPFFGNGAASAPVTMRPPVAAPSPAASAGTPADLSGEVGSLNYYRDRALDFERRNPGMKPPDYYLGYGDKYVHRFHDQLRPELSPQGQKWLDSTLVSLQAQMEAKRAQDPAAFAALERNPTAFRDFAFSTHPKAYTDSGLGSLPLEDDLKILSTPDSKDILSPEGLQQVALGGLDVFKTETPAMFEDVLETSLLDMVA